MTKAWMLCTAPVASAIALGALPCLLGIASVSAEIFKCVDSRAAVTYQSEKCPADTRSVRVETSETARNVGAPDKEAEWRAAAGQRKVVAGMTRRWVREALGAPREIRGENVDGASEVWFYGSLDRPLRVGLREGVVQWVRDGAEGAGGTPARGVGESGKAPLAAPMPGPDPAPVAPGPRPAPAAAPGVNASHSPQSIARRRIVATGDDCAALKNELGPPDHEEKLPPSAQLAINASDARELVYDPVDEDLGVRTRITCIGGKVVSIDRSNLR